MNVETAAMTEPVTRTRFNILFEAISDEEFGVVRPRLKERRYEKDEVILKEGSDGDELHLLVEGRVRVSKPLRDGSEKLLAVLHAGDFFGELELLDHRPRSATVSALDDCITCTLSRRDVEELVAGYPALSHRMMQVLSVRLRASNKIYLSDMARTVESHRAQVSRLEQLIDASKILNSALDLENLLDVILQTALMVVHADRGTVYLLDEKRQVLWSKVSKVLNGSEVIRIELPVGKGIAGYVAGTGDTLNIRDAYLDTRFNPEIDRSSGYRTHTILCVAIRSKDGTIKGVFQLLNKKNGPFTEDDERSLDALSVHAGIAIERAYLYEKEKSFLRMTEELNVAARIQRELLPKEVPVVPGYDLAGKMVPAQAIGGDYFDFIPIEQSKLAICVGDVSGKGLPAALLMGNVQASVRGQALVSESPRQCVTNASLLLFRSTAAEKFATLFYAVLDSVTHELRFSNAGHDKPIFVRKEAEVGRLATGGVPLGILENFPYEEECVTLREGESIVICSDGIPEARNAEGLEFGEARLVETVLNHRSDPPEKVVDEVIRAVREHTGDAPQWDDMTVVAVRRNI